MKKPIFLAHRGGWKPGRRENSAGAIERASSSGRFTYIELDVRRTRSGDDGTQTPILIHDETLDRLYEQYSIPKSKRHRLGQPVSGLNIEIIRNEAIDITTLAEAMRAANGHPLNLEVKSIEALDAVLETVQDMVSKYSEWSFEKIVISSFNWQILEEVKNREPALGIALLYGWKNLPRNFGRTYNILGARWISFDKWLAPFMAPLAKILGINQVYAYSINSVLAVRLLTMLGVNGFFTDLVKLPDMLD